MVRCPDEVSGILADRGALEPPAPAPPSGSGGQVARYRTNDLGRWVVVTQEVDGALTVVEHSPDSSRGWLFSHGACDVSRVGTPTRIGGNGGDPGRAAAREADPGGGAGAGVRGFRDVDLEKAIAEAAPNPVVVYLWSPHMPLAVDGVAEILTAGQAIGARVEVVLIAHADPDFARREAERVGMPSGALRVASSIELLMRDGQLHAPSILIFSAERVSPVLPGYRNAEGYIRFISAFGRGDEG